MYTQKLKSLGITTLNAMQTATLEAARSATDIILLSPTGSGKTVAFALPLLERLTDTTHTQALIIVPTRELAVQIESVLRVLASPRSVCSCYGGHALRDELKALAASPAVVVGTPGRLIDHLQRGSLACEAIHTLVLDEFDKSLEMGFQEEMATLIAQLGNVNKRILTSATEGLEIPSFTGITTPVRLHFAPTAPTGDGLTLYIVESPERDKLNTLLLLLGNTQEGSTLIFANQRESVERIGEFLQAAGVSCALFHGGLEQPERERALCRFRNNSTHILVSTDLAARGLDIPDIAHIIHYHLPVNQEAFTHRNGRTARMHRSGNAYLLINEVDLLPDYITSDTPYFALDTRLNKVISPSMETLYIGKGKRDKVSKGDIVGFLTQKGGLSKEEIGSIEVKELFALVAVSRARIEALLPLIQGEKIKGMKARFEIAM